MKRFPYRGLNTAMDRHGWIITGVPGGAIYTVGLIDKWSHPELMVHGLPAGLSEGILRSAVDLVAEGQKFEVGSRVPRVVRVYDVVPIEVHPSNYWDWLGMALDYHGRDLEVEQLLWPDSSGRFPGDPEYASTPQWRFDVRRPEYDQVENHEHGIGPCACCGEEL